MVDPKNPGVVDEIIHLGDFWDDAGIREHREDIFRDGREIGALFARAYRYIKAAACLHEDSAAVYSRAAGNSIMNMLAQEWIDEIFAGKGLSSKEGRQRHLFASAITPEGLKNHLETVLATRRVYAVKGMHGTGTERILEKVRAAAAERGCYTESYYCALLPSKLEHLVIPGMDVSITTVNDYHDAQVQKHAVMDLDGRMDGDAFKQNKDVLEYNRREFDALLGKAVETIKKAKAVHDRLEKYYAGSIDFEAVGRCREAVLARILGA